MRVSIVGAGYVGLVAGACLADTGHHVRMIDRDSERIALLHQGGCPIVEPGLPELLRTHRAAGRLVFTTDPDEGVRDAEVVFITVGTPALPDGLVDLSAVDGAVKTVLKALTCPVVLVLKSTVPVGTHVRVQQFAEQLTPHRVEVVSNPEFLQQGRAVEDFRNPHRVIVGADTARAFETLRRLYQPFLQRPEQLLHMDPTSAELAKYACNTMLAARVSFMNELSRVCEAVGADIEFVRQGVGTDPRIGPHFLNPSLGYGGSCFPKDVQALAQLGRIVHHPIRVAEATHCANLDQREHWLRRICEFVDPARSTVAVWGTAFKAHTDDVRDSPAVDLVRRLRDRGARLRVHDPCAMEPARKVLGDERITWCPDMYDAVDGADALIVATEWPVYRTPDFGRMARQMRTPLLFDGRNLYDADQIRRTPFSWWSVGRPPIVRQGASRLPAETEPGSETHPTGAGGVTN